MAFSALGAEGFFLVDWKCCFWNKRILLQWAIKINQNSSTNGRLCYNSVLVNLSWSICFLTMHACYASSWWWLRRGHFYRGK